MEFDESKKIEVDVTENQFVENRIESKPRRHIIGSSLDAIDLAIIPVALGIFVSLGFLFATILKASAANDIATNIGNVIASIIG